MHSRRLVGLLVLACAAGFGAAPWPALAELGDVLHTIPCPGDNPADLAWVDGELYSVIFSPTEQRGIYRLDPATGDVLGMVPYAGSMPQGLAYDGDNLWQVCLSGDCVYKMDPITGEIRDVFAAPGGADGQPIGLGWDGASLWLDDSRDPEKIWQLDSLGAVLGQIPAPGDSPYGLAWADGYVWVSDNSLGEVAYIFKLDPQSGEILDSFLCPDGGGSPNGIAHDGEYLWVAVNTTDTIYQVDDGVAGANVPGAIASHTAGLRLLLARSDQADQAVLVSFLLDDTSLVRAQLFDLLGRQSSAPRVARHSAGAHEIRLPQPTSSGVYYVRLGDGSTTQTGKVLLIQ